MSELMDFESMTAYDKLKKIYYQISVRTLGEKELWGRVNGNSMFLSAYGRIAQAKIPILNTVHDSIYVEKSVVMPNHVHFLVAIEKSGLEYTPTEEEMLEFLGEIVERYKKSVSAAIIKLIAEGQRLGVPYDPSREFWHKGCHIRGIHNLYDYKKAVAHISNNVEEWTSDRYYRLTVN